jgi:hypothetical protein
MASLSWQLSTTSQLMSPLGSGVQKHCFRHDAAARISPGSTRLQRYLAEGDVRLRRGSRVHPRLCTAVPRGRSIVLRPAGCLAGRVDFFGKRQRAAPPVCLRRIPTERCGSLIPPSDSIAVQTHLSAIPFGPVSLRIQKANSIAGNAPSP